MNEKPSDSEEKVINQLLRMKKIVLYWLLGTIYIAFICFQLGQIQSITDFSFRLHETLYLPIAFAIYVVPFIFLVYMIFVFLCLRNIDSKVYLSKDNKLKTILIVISLVLIFYSINYQPHEISTSGVFVINQKNYRDRSYYIQLGDKEIKCTRNEFNLIYVDKEYLIDYTWNWTSPDTGKLGYIEPILR